MTSQHQNTINLNYMIIGTTVITQNQKLQNSELKWWTFGSNCTVNKLHILMYYDMNRVGILTYSIKAMELL